MKRTLPVLIALLLFITLMAMMPAKKDPSMQYHTPEEIAMFHQKNFPPLDSGQYFHAPYACKGCHGFDSLGLANVNANGVDVNLFDDWQTSMMGLAAYDPFWRAKVSHEIQVNPGHSNQLQTLCTSCHAPMGNYTAKYHGLPYYTLADLVNDTIGLGGVGCMGCHSIGADSLGLLFSGHIPYDTTHVAYGPFDNPMLGPMQLYVGLTPTKSDHVSEGRMCSSCHTLINESVDLSGNTTGTQFIEQATFHEWENSDYPASETPCQSCHMPQITDPIKIANGYLALPGRTPFNLHQFAGANSFMVNLIKTNKNSLGVTASDANFDSTLVAINKQLTQHSVTVDAVVDSITSDTAFISVQLINKAGHKFPSGYPSRRVVLQMIAQKANGDSLFASGTFDTNQEVMNLDPNFEPHHDVINDPSQVQVYEMVMGDVNGAKTTVLERGYSALKDNRIPPTGFSILHSTYDTCAIVGDALNDADFNHVGGVEGSGTDVVHYHIPLNGYSGALNITASVLYQAIPPSFLTEMQTYQSAEIDSFMTYYGSAANAPLLAGQDTLSISVISSLEETGTMNLQVSPSFTTDGLVHVKFNAPTDALIKVYDQQGKLISSFKAEGSTNIEVNLPVTSGIYYISLSKSQHLITRKIFRL